MLGGISNIDAASKVEWKGTKRRSTEKISLECVTEEDEEEANKVSLNLDTVTTVFNRSSIKSVLYQSPRIL